MINFFKSFNLISTNLLTFLKKIKESHFLKASFYMVLQELVSLNLHKLYQT